MESPSSNARHGHRIARCGHYNGDSRERINPAADVAPGAPIFPVIRRREAAPGDLCYDGVTEFARLTAVCGSIAWFQTLVIRLPLPHSPRTPVTSAAE